MPSGASGEAGNANAPDVIVLDSATRHEFARALATRAIAGSRGFCTSVDGARLARAAPPPTTPEVMTADEVADFLRLDRKTVYDYAGRGEIPSKRIGKRLIFSRAALELWLRSCSKGSSESDSK